MGGSVLIDEAVTRIIAKSNTVFGTSTGQLGQKILAWIQAALPEGVSPADVYGLVYDVYITSFLTSCRSSMPHR